jgi:hypothetical protein
MDIELEESKKLVELNMHHVCFPFQGYEQYEKFFLDYYDAVRYAEDFIEHLSRTYGGIVMGFHTGEYSWDKFKWSTSSNDYHVYYSFMGSGVDSIVGSSLGSNMGDKHHLAVIIDEKINISVIIDYAIRQAKQGDLRWKINEAINTSKHIAKLYGEQD